MDKCLTIIRWGHIWFAPLCKEKFDCDIKNIASIYPALG